MTKPIKFSGDENEKQLELFKKYDVDRNFISNAIFTHDKFKGKIKIIEKVVNNPDGSTSITRIVVGDPGHDKIKSGVLYTIDAKMFFILIKIFVNEGMPTDRDLPFTYSYISKELGSDPDGKSYHKITESLNRLAHVTIRWKNTYISKDGIYKTVVLGDLSFSILSILDNRLALNIDIGTGGRKYTGNINYFRFNPYIISNLTNGNTKEFLIDVINSLRKPISILLYIIISGELDNKPAVSFFTEDLAITLGLHEYKYASQRLEKIEPSLKELVGKRIPGGSIRNYTKMKSTTKDDYVITIYKNDITNIPLVAGNEIIKELEALLNIFKEAFPKFSNDLKIDTLIDINKATTIEKMRKYLDMTIYENNINKKNNPAGFFVKACQKSYSTTTYDNAMKETAEKMEDVSKFEKLMLDDKIVFENQAKENKKYTLIFNKLSAIEQNDISKLAINNINTEFINKNGKKPEIIPKPLITIEINNILKSRGL